uniref:Uncharacterized protein n=1 Tax=Psilocybe cubensis TaxID=181762 RepID=A0A8H7XZC9_PSICU
MNGLVSYDYDSPSDSEAVPSTSSNPQNTNVRSFVDKTSIASLKSSSEGNRRLPKSQVIIKRPAISHKTQHLRTHNSDDLISNDPSKKAGPSTEGSPMDISSSSSRQPSTRPGPSAEPQDELARIRALLRPKPIPGVENWGIPAEPTEKCEPALQTQFTRFSSLKTDPKNPKHYNDSLMSNRSFRNPHLYTQLVDWVDVDERTTNFPKDIWDPNDVKPEWFASQIADAQKERSEKQAAAQAPGKRSHIEFSSSKDKAPPPKKSRFQPYGSSGVSGVASTRERQKTRWG